MGSCGRLTVAAEGQKADIAKPLKGVGAGVFEVVLQYRTDAYRTVYALQRGEWLWVVHAFQKKAKPGITTPTKEIDLIPRTPQTIEAGVPAMSKTADDGEPSAR